MIKIAILGYGVVGSGVISVLERNEDIITKNAGKKIEVKYILDVREFPKSPHKSLFVDDFNTILSDSEIKIVVEVIGGTGAALDFTRKSLKAGKSVVTSNKELVALHGQEMMSLAQEFGVNYLFEASVGGAIPIIRPLVQCMTANIISEMCAILNGTTNYILTDMAINNVDFHSALKEAQKKGYAENDPTADIEGFDACRKICILSSIAFGRQINPDDVETTGISAITINDIYLAKLLGYKIKLLARARSVHDNVLLFVAPHLVSSSSLLYGIDGVMNAAVIRGNASGDILLGGAGAGKLPTASAVVADVIDSVRHIHARRWINWSEDPADKLYDPKLMESAWFIRTTTSQEKIEREFGSVLFASINHHETAFITNVMNENMLNTLLSRDINVLSKLRILGDY